MEYVWEHNNTRLHYREKGKGEVLLFLPGAIRATIYEKTVDELAKTYKVILPDLPGFGISTVPPSSWGFADYASFMKKFMDSLAMSSYVLVGHSFGGGVGLSLASMDSRVKKLFVYGSMGVKSNKSIATFYYDMFIKKTITDLFYAHEFRVKRIMFNNGLSTLLENLDEVYPILKIANRCIYSTLSSLSEITIPTYIVAGKKDELFPITDARYIHKQIVGSELVVTDTPHDWCILEPEKFTSLVVQRLKKNK